MMTMTKCIIRKRMNDDEYCAICGFDCKYLDDKVEVKVYLEAMKALKSLSKKD